MFSLQRLISPGGRFFDLLEASAQEGQQSVQALVELVTSPQDGWTLEKFILRRKEDKRITEEITSLLCSTFVTPLEREDIESLSSALSRIPKVIKKFAERLLLSQFHHRADLFANQASLLQRATGTLLEMVRQLRRHPRLDKVQQQNDLLRVYESEADKLILDLLQDLYGGKYDALQVIVLRDLYELLEKVIDRCRDAGNVVLQIVLKYA